MRTRPFARAATAAAFTLVLWQCGGGGDEGSRTAAAGRGARVEACELVPKSEMETIVGASVASTQGNFSEHTYTTPPSYTASCMYLGERAVMLAVNYPAPRRQISSEQLAAQITEHLRSQVGSDPSTDELFKSIQVRPVTGLAGAAAEYEMMDQTTLEVHTGDHMLKVMAPSLDAARGVAGKALERLN